MLLIKNVNRYVKYCTYIAIKKRRRVKICICLCNMNTYISHIYKYIMSLLKPIKCRNLRFSERNDVIALKHIHYWCIIIVSLWIIVIYVIHICIYYIHNNLCISNLDVIHIYLYIFIHLFIYSIRICLLWSMLFSGSYHYFTRNNFLVYIIQKHLYE